MQRRVKGKFACGYCRSPEIVVPANPDGMAIVACGSCGQRLASWAAVRAQVEGRAFEVSGDCERQQIMLREL
jgi:transcription elongation factor Elf1